MPHYIELTACMCDVLIHIGNGRKISTATEYYQLVEFGTTNECRWTRDDALTFECPINSCNNDF